MDDQSMFFELIRSLLLNVSNDGQSQNSDGAQMCQRQMPTTSYVESFPNQANGFRLDPRPITSPGLDEFATRNLANTNSNNTHNNVTLDSSRAHSFDQLASANWLQILPQQSNDHNHHQHHHLQHHQQQQQQNQLMAQHFLHGTLNANQLGSLNYWYLLGHLQASLTSSSCSSSTSTSTSISSSTSTSTPNNNFVNNNSNMSLQAPNTSLSSNIVNNYSITNINSKNNINNNNNVTVNKVETCNPQAIVAHQPSVPTSSFLAKLTAVTSRTSAHSKTMCLDDKNVLDLLEAFYLISDQPDPAAVEMIAKAIKTNSETVANWYDNKRAKLNGLSTIRRENDSCVGNYDVVDATSDFLSSKSITGRSVDSNGIANTCNTNRKRAGGRVVTFSEYQRALLETIFDDNNYLHPQEYEVLSNLIEVPARNIKIWFKNRRSKQRLSGRTSGS